MLLPRRPLLFPSLLLCSTILLAFAAQAQAVRAVPSREARHQSVEWLTVAPHLPDPATGSPAALKMAGDVLRARRLPEDAMDYYGFAMQRGGDGAELLNRMGVTQLELQNVAAARIYFRRATKAQPKAPEGWNNLGAVEYLQKNFRNAIKDYHHAVKLDKTVATYHSNMGTAYFEEKEFGSAREEFERALLLDPEVFHHAGNVNGVNAHILSPEDRARFCFELAKLSLRRNDEAGMLYWLAKASESGFDIVAAMAEDTSGLWRYRTDARVAVLVQNAHALREKQMTALAPPPALPPESPAK